MLDNLVHRVRSSTDKRGMKVLRLVDNSLNFDYAHFLPNISKCSVLHGHSARVIVEVVGTPSGEGILVDFGVLKSLTKSVLSELDHRLLVAEKYVKGIEDGSVLVEFYGKDGPYSLKVPLSSVLITDFEITAENLSHYIANKILRELPDNVKAVKVTVYEGLGKSAISRAIR